MDVSALGFSILVTDDKIFPNGFQITRTADGADPLDLPDVTIGEATVDANGWIVYASTPQPLLFNMNLLPLSDEDENMSVLFNAHRPAAGRARTGGKMSVTVQYADGSSMSATDVKFIGGSIGKSIQQPSRYKNKQYMFAAQDFKQSKG
jgi:hypothetical protein